jgi:hypothetical protein
MDTHKQIEIEETRPSRSLKNRDNETAVMQQRMAKLNCCTETKLETLSAELGPIKI